MRIHVYTICWNEEKILPFFIRHYQQFAEKIVFYDNESTDNSRKIIESSAKCYYKTYSSKNELRDDLYQDIKNNVWKESRGQADFVIVVDTDEFVYTKWSIKNYLRILKLIGFTLIRPRGFDMVTDQLDWESKKQITELVRHGKPFAPMNKPCIFNPDKIDEINYNFGAHSCKAIGKKREFRADWLSKYLNPGFYLLHYKSMGLDYIIKRQAILNARLSGFNKQKKLGFHYSRTEQEITKEFEHHRRQASSIL